MTRLTIVRERPDGSDLSLLMARHAAEMQADTPPESTHMMTAAALAADRAAAFFVLRDAGVPVAMGAFRRIGPDHAELKSMHVLAERLGEGLARRMLEHLIASARAEGIARLSPETGGHPRFAAALRLYRAAGFRDCAPLAGYRPDPHSRFLTLTR